MPSRKASATGAASRLEPCGSSVGLCIDPRQSRGTRSCDRRARLLASSWQPQARAAHRRSHVVLPPSTPWWGATIRPASFAYPAPRMLPTIFSFAPGSLALTARPNLPSRHQRDVARGPELVRGHRARTVNHMPVARRRTPDAKVRAAVVVEVTRNRHVAYSILVRRHTRSVVSRYARADARKRLVAAGVDALVAATSAVVAAINREAG